MKISTMLSTCLGAIKVIDEVMKLLNNIEVHTCIYYHTYNIHSYVVYYSHDDYAGILEYPVFSPVVDWKLVYVVSTQSMPWLMLHL